MTFIDTNLFVYFVDRRDVGKWRVAREIVSAAIGSPGFLISPQDLADGQTYCGVRAVNPFK